jgi:hypothetical protein
MNDAWRGRWKEVTLDQVQLVRSYLNEIREQLRLAKLPGDLDKHAIDSTRRDDLLDYVEGLLSGQYSWSMPPEADEQLVTELRTIIARKVT